MPYRDSQPAPAPTGTLVVRRPDRFVIPRYSSAGTKGAVGVIVAFGIMMTLVAAFDDGGLPVALVVLGVTVGVSALIMFGRSPRTTCRITGDTLHVEVRRYRARSETSFTLDEQTSARSERREDDQALILDRGDGPNVVATGEPEAIARVAHELNTRALLRHPTVASLPPHLRTALTDEDLALATRQDVGGPLVGFFARTPPERIHQIEAMLRDLPVAELVVEATADDWIVRCRSAGSLVVTTVSGRDSSELGSVRWSTTLARPTTLELDLRRDRPHEPLSPAQRHSLDVLPAPLRDRIARLLVDEALELFTIDHDEIELEGSVSLLQHRDPIGAIVVGIELVGELAQACERGA